VREIACFVERATEADLEALLDLERRSFSHPWTARDLSEILAWGSPLVLRRPWMASDPTRGVVGCCVFRVITDEMEVFSLAIDPPYRGSGLGRRLLEAAMRVGILQGAGRVFLEVRRSNLTALRLYDSLGFKTISIREDYYVEPREDAVVLEKTLESGRVAHSNHEP